MIGPVLGVLFDGFAYGMLLFLLSVGLSVTLGMMNFVNLAHCSFAMLGGYVTVTLMNGLGWPFLATLPCAFWSRQRSAWRSSARSTAACTARATSSRCYSPSAPARRRRRRAGAGGLRPPVRSWRRG